MVMNAEPDVKHISEEINPLKILIHTILFGSKWILVIFYIGLIAAQCFYCFKFCQEIYHLASHFVGMEENQLMLAVLTLIDITMIANLIKMIIVGSYQSFIEKVRDSSTERVSSGLLKVKLGSSLIGVSSIHLLQTFINSTNMSIREVVIKCVIHMLFLISTIGLAYVDYLHHKSEEHEA